MHSYNNAYFIRLPRLLKMSGINFVTNPMVNTHLQRRMDTYPKRRGVTRVKELTEAGLHVSFGQDGNSCAVRPPSERSSSEQAVTPIGAVDQAALEFFLGPRSIGL